MADKVEIDKKLYDKLCYLGIIDNSGVRDHNIGNSDYSKHLNEISKKSHKSLACVDELRIF
jgi:hypothetical protein